jgi:hypothetical protein
MSTLKDLEKLEFLLTHWVEHNREHSSEFRNWAQRAEQMGAGQTAKHLYAAVQHMESTNNSLSAALAELERDQEGKR